MYASILVAVSMNAEWMFLVTVGRELNEVSRNMAWDWSLNVSGRDCQ